MTVAINVFRRATENLGPGERIEAFAILWEEMDDQERIEAVKNNAGDLAEELVLQLGKEIE